MSITTNCHLADARRIAALESAIKHGHIVLEFWNGRVWMSGPDRAPQTYGSIREALDSLPPSGVVDPPTGAGADAAPSFQAMTCEDYDAA